MDAKRKAVSHMIKRILEGETDLDKLKREAGRKFRLSQSLKNTAILKDFPRGKLTIEIVSLLKRKPMRTLSGVAPIAVMIKPEGSCRWSCIYCPYTGKAPKSYTGSEPAAMRAIDNDFNAARQVKSRIAQFELNGHNTSKCDVIIMGGTFLAMPPAYRNRFIKGIYGALNGKSSKTLEAAKKLNESAKHRMVGLTFETRPDVCGIKEINEMLDAGGTKVELGVQHPSDEIYGKICRGHSVSHVVDATGLLKDSAFKVAYHLMPGLPGSSPQKDIAMFRRIFSSPDFRPDMLKIYPTLVIPGTRLHKLMEKGEYQPYSTETAAEVIAKAYEHIPKYARVMRIQRDIPANLIAGGVKKSNLREIVERKTESMGIKINEIRHREAGLGKKPVSEPRMQRLDYGASGGDEVFLSIEDRKNKALAAFLRLRIPGKSLRAEITGKTALVRELHVYGEETQLGEKGSVQHRGFGSALLAEAEKIASEEFGKSKITVISAVGVRPYYYPKGYAPDGPYVSKRIK
ncbi:Uncharacterised protein [uncultured archaeon]|nr:Uncharacterised protein [uncultured archaeon]